MPPDLTAADSEDQREEYQPWTDSAQVYGRFGRAVRTAQWRCINLSPLRTVHHCTSVQSRHPLWTLAENTCLLQSVAEGVGI
jgi:hypothetical protein